ncbi:hypothetical protein GWK47_011007 [Chionoecetes opilio]|uniref:Uncharacterized protein n=1 Tax=Chionoecetes opilio TaxID=41210 RepID=A0A8J4XXQ7_CHIOP|nr:hypothetical protein GWK47_011007 [Chionoecetes opilio]
MDKNPRMLSTNFGAHGKCPLNLEKLQEITANVPAIYPTTEVNKLGYGCLGDFWRGGSSQLPPLWDSLSCSTTEKTPGGIWRRSSAEPPICCEPNRLRLETDEDGKLCQRMRGPQHQMLLALLSQVCGSCELPKMPLLSNGLKCTDSAGLQTPKTQGAFEEEPVAQQSDPSRRR